jgi:hypothetical protein
MNGKKGRNKGRRMKESGKNQDNERLKEVRRGTKYEGEK